MGDVNICMETILRCAGAASACPYICSQRAYRASTISVAEYGSQSLRALRRWSHSARVGWSLHALVRAPRVGEYPPRHTCLWRLLGIHGRSSTLPRCCSYGIRPLRRRSRPMVRYSFIYSFSTVWFTVSLLFTASLQFIYILSDIKLQMQVRLPGSSLWCLHRGSALHVCCGDRQRRMRRSYTRNVAPRALASNFRYL